MKRAMKKSLAGALALAVLCCAFVLQSYAAPDDGLAIAFSTAETQLPREAAFSVDISLEPTGAGVSALRLYVLYDNACFTWNADATQRAGLAAQGMYAQQLGTGSEKYPAEMDSETQAKYDVIVLQWAAVPSGAALPAIPAGGQTLALTLGFQVKADAPYAQPGGKIYISDGYSYADTPYFYAQEYDTDVTAAQVTIQPMPPAPALQTDLTISGGYIYGFPQSLAQVGSVEHWSGSALADYVSATNGGVFKLLPSPASGMAGTGAKLQLWNANETLLAEEYTLIVFGDADGNFVVDYDDWAAVQAMEPGAVGSDPYRFAADIDADGTISASDLQAVYDAAAGRTVISQTR